MDAAAAKLQSRLPKSRKDLKPKRSHFFYGLIVVLGWLCPPIAILVRFGIGFDFFLNIILTVCGYIPGHAHNFYCQSVRNNKTKARTPRWAIKAGLVEIEDNRGGRHQWAHRYDERLAGDNDSVAGSWDGHGPEPQRGGRRLNKSGNRRHHGLAPWDNVVDDDEVEGEPEGGLYRNRSNLAPPSRTNSRLSAQNDPLTSEQFYETPSRDAPVAPKKKKSFGSGLIKNRSRYEQQPFDTSDVTSSRTRGSDYQDEFEREINEGSRGGASARAPPVADARFDSFENEGPEDAWATSRPTAAAKNGNGYGNGSAQRLQPQKTGRAEEDDGDLFRHNF